MADLQNIWSRLRRVASRAPAGRLGTDGLPNPGGRMAWLTLPPRTRALRWFLTPWQTRIALIALALMAVLVLLMVFPVLPVASPAWLIYAFHDSVVLPLKGRIFDRYAPVPQIVCAVAVGLAVAAVVGRRFASLPYEWAARLALDRAASRDLLLRWTRWRASDSHLIAETERVHRDRVASFLLADHVDRSNPRPVVALGHYALDQITSLPRPPQDLVLCNFSVVQIVARNHCILTLAGISDVRSDRVHRAALGSHGGTFGALLRQVLGGVETPSSLERQISDAWAKADMATPGLRAIAKDALCWTAIVLALRTRDSTLLRQLLVRRARQSFDRDLSAQVAPARDTDEPLVDPVLWAALSTGLDSPPADPGAGLSRPQLEAIRQQLERQSGRLTS